MRTLIPFLLSVAILGCADGQAALTVDTSRPGAPISKYIYGQFIEHLGHSIYGGLWSEMLEDRKFYFIIRDRYAPWGTAEDSYWGSGPYDYLRASPWSVTGPPGTVTMDTDRPFTGIHSPSVHVTGGSAVGISQEGLALVSGRTYTGRVFLSGDPGVTVTVRLVMDDGKALAQSLGAPGPEYRGLPFRFDAPGASDNARLEITGQGTGNFLVGCVSLMPADNLDGWRPDVVALLKELDAPIYRWPGGNFVSGYNWRDGIGDRDRRPPRQNPAWHGVESNDVGIHEYMDLMAMIGAEPYVALNTGLGTVDEVAQEVQYFNGAADTPMGKLRAANGHPAPFGVTWWAVGNEMYGEWQLGHMPIEDYVKKHNAVVDAVRAVDPRSRVVGVGSIGKWDQTILSSSADHLDLISEHVYRRELADVPAHTAQIAAEIDKVARAHRDYRASIPALAGHDIRIAMDEWNYWYGRYVYGELGVQYHLKDALGVARALHAYFRNSDIFFMANYAQTVNVIGAIKTSRTASTLDTTGLVLKLYRANFGSIPVPVSGVPSTVDASAALTEDGSALTIAIVNPSDRPVSLPIAVSPLVPTGKGRRWTITGPQPMAVNVPGQPAQVTIAEQSLSEKASRVEAGPYSVTLYRLELR